MMSINRRSSHHKRGVAMILILFTVALSVVLVLTFAASQQTTGGITNNARWHGHARQIAESGLTMAVDYVNTNEDWRTAFSNGTWVNSQSFDGGTFTITGVDADGDLQDDPTDPVTITAKGEYAGVVHRVSALVTPTLGEPPKKVLFIVPDPAQLDPDDASRISLVQGFGMTVTVMDDSSTQAELDAAMATHDVIYVSKNAVASGLGAKLYNATIGVVTEERGMIADLGMGSGGSSYSGSQIDIAINTHYVTELFSLGALAITNGSQSLIQTSGSPPSGAQTLATRTSGSQPALTVIDAGHAVVGGGTAIARRAVLPWGGSSFDITALNDDGETILRRALEWGAASISVTPNDIGLGVTHTLYLRNQGRVDSWNSGLGPYGADNVGQNAIISTNSAAANMLEVIDSAALHGSLYVGPGGDPNVVASIGGSATVTGTIGVLQEAVIMPDDTPPDGMPSNEGDVSFTSGTHIINTHRHVDDMNIRGSAVVHIQGDVVILCEGSFNMFDNAQVVLDPDATLKVYAKGSGDAIHFEDNAQFNMNTWDPSRTAMFVIGSGEFDMDGSPQVCARVIAVDGFLDVNDDTHFYGTFLGRDIVVEQNGQLHHDTRIGPYPDTDPYTENEHIPQKIVEYDFVEPPATLPQLLHHWALDDTSSGGGGMAANDRVRIRDRAEIDSYNGATGAYGGANITSNAAVSSNSTSSDDIQLYSGTTVFGDVYVGAGGNPSSVIDNDGTITGSQSALSQNVNIGSYGTPSGMPSSQGDQTIAGNQTWSADQRFDKLTIQSSATITINGDVRVLCDDDFELKNSARIVVPDGSSLELWCRAKIKIRNTAQLNPDTTGAARARIYHLVDADFQIDDDSVVSAEIWAQHDILIRNNAQVHGSLIIGDDIVLEDDARLHLDTSLSSVSGIAPPALDPVGGAHGTYTNGPVLGAAGQVGSAVAFDGSNDYIQIPDSASLQPTTSLTIAAWIKPDSFGSGSDVDVILRKGEGNPNNWQLALKDGRATLYLDDSDSSGVSGSTTLTAGQWYHVVGTWDGAKAKIYVNGAPDNGSGASVSGPIGTDNRPVYLGGRADGDYFDGVIDDVRFYDKALDAQQVLDVYGGNALSPSSGPASTVLDTSGFGASLNLEIQDPANVTWVSGGGLSIDAATRIASPGAATKIHSALTDTDEMTMVVKFQPANITQTGPARIFSYSGGSSTRNVTFGQTTQAYNTRLRTTNSNSNGTPTINSGDVLTTTAEHHVIVTYDGENVKMYRNGNSTPEVTTPRTGTFNWDASFRLLLGNEDGSDSPWLGTLKYVSIFDRALEGGQISNVFSGIDPGDPATTTSGYAVRWMESQ